MQCTKQRSFLIFVCSVAVCCAAALPLADRLAASTPERAQVVLSRSLPDRPEGNPGAGELWAGRGFCAS